jgi:N-acetylglucosaminyldiphosphoundecaprenol N-acetyl-beta-D-mannosaminyltransferase
MAKQIDLLNVRVDRIDFAAAMGRVRQAIQVRRPCQIVTVNVDFVKLAKADSAYRRLINTADLSVADGMPLLWAARLIGAPLPERITGTDLVIGCAQMAATEGHRLFLLGAAPGVAEQAAAELERRFPGLTVCGTYAPPFGPWAEDEDRQIVERIRAARPDVLFVAFGAPRQDVWIREHMAELDVPVSVGIGGTLNFLAGKIRRAPQWMQDFGLEWLYRVVQEPGRLWKRYLLEDFPIFFQLLAQARLTPDETLIETAPAFRPRLDLAADAPTVSIELTSR